MSSNEDNAIHPKIYYYLKKGPRIGIRTSKRLLIILGIWKIEFWRI
jgi:hypothetical protein